MKLYFLNDLERELSLTYIDKLTFMNHIKNFARKDLKIESDTTPYILDSLLDYWTNGCCTRLINEVTKEESLHCVRIKDSLELRDMIRTILHETKHVEQFINQPLYYRIATKAKNFLEKHNLYNDIFYLLAFHEIAARRYARKTMKKYYKQLNKIIKDAYENKLEEILA
jgi:hypothetical protein